ncbi:uncharacterized protein LOC141718650 [Apium graveolens]|uniref:uncharacterized protein LOC141718650 n=1 Tax=Apium graveolens TaxID=4045 RepID=UPI003D7A3025
MNTKNLEEFHLPSDQDHHEGGSIADQEHEGPSPPHGVLDKDKLTITNFFDWKRNLRIVLRQERKLHVINVPRPEPLPEGAMRVKQAAYQKHIDDDTDVTCLMLVTMSPELQKQYEHMDAYVMIEHHKRMFEGQARQETFGKRKSLYACKQNDCDPVGPHFVMNYNMNEIDKTPNELLAMLKTVETNIQKASPAPTIMVNKGSAKGKGKCKGKKTMGSKSVDAPKIDPKQALKLGGVLQRVILVTIARNRVIGRETVMLFLEDLQ